MTSAPPDAALVTAYRDHDLRLHRRRLLVANGIASVGMLAGVALDYFVYPAQLTTFLFLRLGVVAVLLAISAAVAGLPRLPLPALRAAGVLCGWTMILSFCGMIYLTDGARSPYVVGLILVVMALSLMLPWTVIETAAMCAGSLTFYAAACLANPSSSSREAESLLAYYVSFIIITSAVCIAVTFFLARARFEDFRLRHQLDAQNRELQDLDRLKTQFFSNVSHELRTPLTLILSPVESLLARGEALDGRVHDSLILVHRNSLRLLKLINDLLDLTRLDQGAELLRKRAFAARPFVKGIVDSVRHLGMAKKLRLRVEDGDDSLAFTADPARLEKVLVNLLTNAIKYTPVGGAVTVRWLGRPGETALEVQDTGVGIPPEDRAKIFDRFHQVRGNLANQTQGVGIGLALAREIVEEHGGRIEVESAVGQGSTFRVLLPRESAPATEAAPRPVDEDEEPFERAFRSADRTLRPYGEVPVEELPMLGEGREVVLVADDENDMREFVVSLLAEDYRVVQTRHGGNVRDLVAEHEPTLVLLDWMMPGKDGLAVCQELRANPAWRDLKIMLLTARIDEKSKLDALAAGADDFLTKPFSSVEVRTRVANLVRAARLQRDLRARHDELQATLEKLQRTEMMLIQSEKMNAIGSLSAGLLHEINNPLNYTLTAMSLVHQFRDGLSPDLQELLGDIEEGMTRIRDVITDLKNFAYPEKSGQQTLFRLQEVIRDARKIAAGELDEIDVQVDLPVDIVVQGQKTQFTHVFINLFNNAAKALRETRPRRRGEIRVSAVLDDERATIEFSDNGPGIPEANLTRIFEPFFTTRDVGEGMGMGLSIVHTIMESHGGAISVRNAASGGAVFTLQIPLAEKALKSC